MVFISMFCFAGQTSPTTVVSIHETEVQEYFWGTILKLDVLSTTVICCYSSPGPYMTVAEAPAILPNNDDATNFISCFTSRHDQQ